MSGKSPQLSLFGDYVPEPVRPAERSQAAVLPMPVSEQDADSAAQLAKNVRLGTSSWSFPGWRGIVFGNNYSDSLLSRQGLSAYSQNPLFRTVGVDRTFYAPVTADVFQEYAAQVPEDFRFLAKAHEHLLWRTFPDHARYGNRRGETNPQYLDAAYARDQVVQPFVEGLQNKAGILLFQVPPQDLNSLGGPGKFHQACARFFEELPSGATYAMELRDSKLLNIDHREIVEEFGLATTLTVHPTMPPIRRQWDFLRSINSPALVIRWMLNPHLTYARAVAKYEPFDRLHDEDPLNRSAVAEIVAEVAALGKPVYVVANNKAEGCSPLTLRKLAAELAAQGTPATPF